MRRLLTVPGLVVTTALTTAVSWGATTLLTRLGGEVRPEDAIAFSLETEPGRMSGVGGAGQFMVIPATARTTGAPGPGCDDFHTWAVRNGGVDGDRTVIRVFAQGTSDKAVAITGLTIRVLEKRSPSRGIPVSCPTAGDLHFRAFSVDLDASPPKLSDESNSGAPFAFTLAKGETEAFTLTVRGRKAAYRWRPVVDVVVEGERRTLALGPPNGFTTTAVLGKRHWEWNFQDAWQLQPAGGSMPRVREVPAGSALPRPS
ncbi:hypothetical protein [Sphaerisporangium flaviroseum]|uniref:hypothetical protein n=1 Tax=Sphaerisporangium flaviroseum TaxID=509199 RepID=UPI0031E7047F